MILAVQCALGEVGSKRVTQLKYPSGPYYGLVDTGKNIYAMNDGGIWQINYVPVDGIPTDDDQPILYSVRLNASDFGVSWNLKKINFVYVSLLGEYNDLSVSLRADEGKEFFSNKAVPQANGFRASCMTREQGAYWTIGLDSYSPFTLLGMDINYIIRPAGISNRC